MEIARYSGGSQVKFLVPRTGPRETLAGPRETLCAEGGAGAGGTVMIGGKSHWPPSCEAVTVKSM